MTQAAVTELLSSIEYTSNAQMEIKSGYDTDTQCWWTLHRIERSKVTPVPRTRADYGEDIATWVSNNHPFFMFNTQAVYYGKRLINGVPDEHERSDNSTYFGFFGFTEQGEPKYVKDYEKQYKAADLPGLGFYNATSVYWPIFLDGVEQQASELPDIARTSGLITTQHNRTIFAWDDYDYYVGFIEGRMPFCNGATGDEIVQMVRKWG